MTEKCKTPLCGGKPVVPGKCHRCYKRWLKDNSSKVVYLDTGTAHLKPIWVCSAPGCNARAKIDGRCGYHKPRDHEHKSVKVAPFVYAVHFPDAGVLKVGKSSFTNAPLSNAAGKMAEKGFAWHDGEQVWTHSGSYREEQFMHGMLAYYYPPVFTTGTRMSEWYNVGSADIGEILALLDDIWSRQPAGEGSYAA